MAATLGLANRRIAETPIAVIDLETTGLTPGYDRVVEVSVVRIDPGEEPRLALDTLVNPTRPVDATEIHGIRDADVKDAPRFSQIAGDLIAAVQGCALAAYNVYFDMRFLDFELSNVGVNIDPPYFCLMYLRPMLGLGSRCRLDEACRLYGVDYKAVHVASEDAMASGWLYLHYLDEIDRKGISTFSDLARLRNYKFNQSFGNDLIPSSTELGLSRFDKLVSRSGFELRPDPMRLAFASYWDTLKTALADLEISDVEFQEIKELRKSTILSKEQIRVVHARVFSSVITQFSNDQWIDDQEVIKLRKLHQCLAKLGWAPGQ